MRSVNSVASAVNFFAGGVLIPTVIIGVGLFSSKLSLAPPVSQLNFAASNSFIDWLEVPGGFST